MEISITIGKYLQLDLFYIPDKAMYVCMQNKSKLGSQRYYTRREPNPKSPTDHIFTIILHIRMNVVDRCNFNLSQL